MGFATVEGRTIHYQFPQEAESGVRKGHVVLLVHGAYDNHKVWKHQYRYLEREHTPLSIDLPGHGESEGPAINNAAEFREFISAFVGVMNAVPFVFCGHSMGGSMALDYALHYPEDLKGIIPVGSAPKWETSAQMIKSWKENPEAGHKRNLGYLFSKKTPQSLMDEYGSQLRTTPMESCLADSYNCASYDLEANLNKIGIPSLVICGDEEAWIEGSRKIHTQMPHSTLEIVPAAGHAIMLEQPEALNRALGAFLSNLS